MKKASKIPSPSSSVLPFKFIAERCCTDGFLKELCILSYRAFCLLSIFVLFLIMILVLSCTQYRYDEDTSTGSLHLAQTSGNSCCTEYGRCALRQPRSLDSACYCGSPHGPIPGFVCN